MNGYQQTNCHFVTASIRHMAYGTVLRLTNSRSLKSRPG